MDQDSVDFAILNSVVQAISSNAVVVDESLRVLCGNLNSSSGGNLVAGKFLSEILDETYLEVTDLQGKVRESFDRKIQLNLDRTSLKIFPAWKETKVDTLIAYVHQTHAPRVLIVFSNVSHEESLQYQIDILYELGFYMVGTLELNRLLFLILTGLTAGPALGFNRAMIFLVDDEKRALKGVLGVGPSTAEEAGEIWSRVSQKNVYLKDFLSEYEGLNDPNGMPMTVLTRELSCLLEDHRHLLIQVMKSKKIWHTVKATLDESINPAFYKVFQSVEFITVPLIAGDEVLGVIVADNRFNWNPIEKKSRNMLSLFAHLAGIAIQNAYRHEKIRDQLKQTQRSSRLLGEANQKLSKMQQYATVGKMAGFVSHEIRNPLATIGGFARSSLRNIDDKEKVARNSEIIVKEVKRLEELLTQVLDYMREQVPKTVKTDLNALIDEVIELAHYWAESKTVRLVFDRAQELHEIAIDATMMKQAILNILKNAIHFSPVNSDVLIRTRLDRNVVLIEVIDQGPGIHPANKNKIFEPFFTTEDKGTGLGLTITRRIIEAHRGQLALESGEGKGTKVSILLPELEGD